MVFLVLCAVFALSTSRLHAASTSTAIDPFRITIPADHGYLGDIHATSEPGAPVIIHIQETHANYDTQQHLVAILEYLIQRYGVRLILVEGGDGDVSLSYFRDYGSLEQRKRAAEKYLRAGILSAEEYLDITSDYPLILWGVEDRQLYQRNWQTLQEAEPLRESFQPFLTQVRQAATQLKPRLLSAASKELDEAREAFDRDEMGLTAYTGLLWRLAKQQPLDMAAYDEVARFVTISEQEQRLNLSEVQQEQQTLVQRLQQAADSDTRTAVVDPSTRAPASLDEARDRLAGGPRSGFRPTGVQEGATGLPVGLHKANAVKAGTAPQVEFYEVVVDLATRQGLALEDYPHLTDYVAYLHASKQIRPAALSDQLEQLATALRTASSGGSPESRQLTKLLEELTLIERLVKIELSPDEYQRVRRLPAPGLLCGWGQFLEKQLRLQNLDVPTFAACGALEAQVPQVARFYETASLRDQALVTQAMSKLQESGERLAVLITGGFHSPEIMRLLRERGLGVVAVTPKVDQPSDPAVYQAVLKYKQGLMSLDQVMALTHPSATSGGSGR